MARKRKAPSIDDLRNNVVEEISRWKVVRKKGTDDPFYHDGVNLNLIRNHVIYYKRSLLEACMEQQVRPCPKEAKLKTPKHVPETFCAPGSKAWPCRDKRKKK